MSENTTTGQVTTTAPSPAKADAAINIDDRAADIAASGGRQKSGHGGDLVRFDHAAQRTVGINLLPAVFIVKQRLGADLVQGDGAIRARGRGIDAKHQHPPIHRTPTHRRGKGNERRIAHATA